MKTASHYTFTGPGRICISIGSPRGAPAGYKMFRKLAPSRDLLRVQDQVEYERRFRIEVLGPLDPQKTWDELHKLAGAHEPVIQCFEKPPFNAKNWCHRRMVAKWFQDTLGHIVREVGFEEIGTGDGYAGPYQPSQVNEAQGDDQQQLIRRSAAVERIRVEIDVFWTALCVVLGIKRNWTWSGLPDRVRDQMDSTDMEEWLVLQDRYRAVDLAR